MSDSPKNQTKRTKATSADRSDIGAKAESQRTMNPGEAGAGVSHKADKRPKGIIHLKGLSKEQLYQELKKELQALGHRIVEKPEQNQPK